MLTRSIFATVLAVAALAALPGGAAAAPASSGAVVFSKLVADSAEYETAQGEKFVKPPEGGLFAAKGGRLNQLTENPTDSQPDFSPDGRLIAFVRDGDVHLMRADGSGQRALTSGPEIDGRPLFAPNGRYLLFERRAAAGERRDLHTVRLGGSTPRRLVHYLADEAEATFSPDGRTIAFVIPGGSGAGATDEIYTVRPSGARLRGVSHTGPVDEFAPRFFARGIVFSRGRSGEGSGAYADVYTSLADGRRPRPLVRGAGSAYVEDVSANGRMLLFRRAQGLWVKRLPGSRGPKRAGKLTEVADQSQTNAVFSSDGREVAAFAATETATEARQTLTAVAVAGGRDRALAAGFSFAQGTLTTAIGPVIAWQPAPRRGR
ncbi:MAG: hypothetical protein WDZ46_06960 [Solirubrobacterales bacterium]